MITRPHGDVHEVNVFTIAGYTNCRSFINRVIVLVLKNAFAKAIPSF
jgi:hypothetical protein